ncbi:hypothetical protein RCL1_000662 [Eukaryota sp. TZLM3-RCL]
MSRTLILFAVFVSIVLCLEDIPSYVNSLPENTWRAKAGGYPDIKRSFLPLQSSVSPLVNFFRTTSSWLPTPKSPLKSSPLPDSYDVRTGRTCQSFAIRDQLQCGSCYAFSAAEVLSDHLCIFQNTNTILSPQHIVSCSNNMGCNGGTVPKTLSFLKKGVVTEDDFPYVSGDGETIPKCPKLKNKTKYKAKNVAILTHEDPEEAMMEAIMSYGSVLGTMMIYVDFIDYESGIYKRTVIDDDKYKLGGHAIKIVGWGEENGVKYWTCANSWSEKWGERGYFRILRGVNEVGIEGTTGFLGKCPPGYSAPFLHLCLTSKYLFATFSVLGMILLCCLSCCYGIYRCTCGKPKLCGAYTSLDDNLVSNL